MPKATEALSEAERKVAFHTQPVWKRAATVFAGPLFNFLLTIAVFTVMFSLYGRFVSEPMVAEVRADSPAAVAGFEPGDRFVTVEGERVETFSRCPAPRFGPDRRQDRLRAAARRQGSHADRHA